MSKVINIKTTSSNVCCDKQLNSMLTELLHSKVTLLLTKITMQSLCIISILNQLICHFLCFYLSTTENNSKYTWIKVHNTLQGKILVFRMNKIIDMIYMFCTFITTTYNNFFVFVQIAFSDSFNFLAHCCREKKGILIFRQLLENSVYTVRETHFKHLVSLVKNNIINMG